MAVTSRNSSVELLRIICMLMIVGGHVIGQHHTDYSLTNVDEIIKLFFKGAFAVAVNAFVLISGYYCIHFKTERLLKLLIQTWFYSVSTLLMALAIGWHVFNMRTDIFKFFPVLTKQYWFVTCYVVLYVISPWLNKWVNCLDRRDYGRLLSIGFIVLYLWPTLSFLVFAPRFIGDAGYGIVNFVYLYMLGRYLQLYYTKKNPPLRYWGGYFLSIFILFVCQYGLSWVLGFEFTSWLSYNTVFIFCGALCMFMAFKEMTFSSRIVNYWAKPCLAVYLIHLSCLWGSFCEVVGVENYHGWSYVLLIVTLPVVIYIVCALIEIIRERLFSSFENRMINRLSKVG